MICSSCRRTLLSRLQSATLNTNTSISSASLRYASTVPATPNAAPAPAPTSTISIGQANPTQSSNTSGTSQFLSEPDTLFTSSAKTHGPTSTKDGKHAAKPLSSIPGGKELRGLGYTKSKPKVLAMEDDEYPAWLWTLLDDTRPGATGEKVDLAGISPLPSCFPSSFNS